MAQDSLYWDLTLVYCALAAWPFLILLIDFIFNLRNGRKNKGSNS